MCYLVLWRQSSVHTFWAVVFASEGKTSRYEIFRFSTLFNALYIRYLKDFKSLKVCHLSIKGGTTTQCRVRHILFLTCLHSYCISWTVSTAIPDYRLFDMLSLSYESLKYMAIHVWPICRRLVPVFRDLRARTCVSPLGCAGFQVRVSKNSNYYIANVPVGIPKHSVCDVQKSYFYFLR